MALLLVLVFLVAPLVELAVIVQVAGEVGVLNTIGLLIAVSLVGAWLARREGVGVVRRIQATLQRGQVPSTELVDGGLILFAGALMITPGFVSDVLALVLLLPPTRAAVRVPLLRYLSRRGRMTVMSGGPGGRGGFGGFGVPRDGSRQGSDGDIWDVESWEEPTTPHPRGELGDPT
jgi:UPF0716 protein FxsA